MILTLSKNRLWNAYVHFPETPGTCSGTIMRQAYLFCQALKGSPK